MGGCNRFVSCEALPSYSRHDKSEISVAFGGASYHCLVHAVEVLIIRFTEPSLVGKYHLSIKKIAYRLTTLPMHQICSLV